jgi:hypothetical protein
MDKLRQRLNPDFLVNKTNVFESLTPEDRARVFAELKAYWNDWIKQDLNDLLAIEARARNLENRLLSANSDIQNLKKRLGLCGAKN